MTDQQHPITPPDEMVEEWRMDYMGKGRAFISIAKEIAQWGADQELEACCEWLDKGFGDVGNFSATLRAVRRFKSPNKKQRGLTALKATNLKKDDPLLYQEILNAIEALPND